MKLKSEPVHTERGALLTGSASPLEKIERELTAIVNSLEVDLQAGRIVRPETAARLHEIIARARQILDSVD